MKTFNTLILSVILTGCSVVGATYDSNEYSAFTNVAYITSLTKQMCNTEPETIQIAANQLVEAATYATIFTRHQPHNIEMHRISSEILKLTEEFKKSSMNKMTEGYCKLKLDSIQQVSETAMQAAAAKRR